MRIFRVRNKKYLRIFVLEEGVYLPLSLDNLIDLKLSFQWYINGRALISLEINKFKSLREDADIFCSSPKSFVDNG